MQDDLWDIQKEATQMKRTYGGNAAKKALEFSQIKYCDCPDMQEQNLKVSEFYKNVHKLLTI